MNIVFRVDASTAIGSGHVMRCLTLAKRYRREGHSVSFVMRVLPSNHVSYAEGEGFPVHSLPYVREEKPLTGYLAWLTVSQERDAAETAEVLRVCGQIDRLVIDHYALDTVWENICRPLVHEIMVIDDLANRRHDCDILLDQNFYENASARYMGLVPDHCRLLLGPQHALLRDEFYEIKPRRRDGSLRNILVFYGGSDLTDETTKALCALQSLDLSDTEIHVVVGAGNPQKERVRQFCAGMENTHCHEQVENMADLMNAADLALGAGGTTTWERLALGLPSIVTAIADNQVEICENCAREELISYLGCAEEVDADDIAHAVTSFIEGRGAEGRTLLDAMPAGSVLFLTNNSNTLPLLTWIGERTSVCHYSGALTLEMLRRLKPRLVVSFNYLPIIKEDILELLAGRIINMHISYLPWNRGRSPNVWSYIDDTPKGVTIHVLDRGLDTGDIIVQRLVEINEQRDTLATSYQKLQDALMELCKENWEMLLSGAYTAQPQRGDSSYHTAKDLEVFLAGRTLSWDMTIAAFKEQFVHPQGGHESGVACIEELADEYCHRIE